MKTPQLDPLPGCGSLGLARPVARDLADLAQRKANAPMRASVAQREPGGLFGDDASQLDLVDTVRDAWRKGLCSCGHGVDACKHSGCKSQPD